MRREPPLYRVSAKNEIAILRELDGRSQTLKLLRDFEHTVLAPEKEGGRGGGNLLSSKWEGEEAIHSPRFYLVVDHGFQFPRVKTVLVRTIKA